MLADCLTCCWDTCISGNAKWGTGRCCAGYDADLLIELRGTAVPEDQCEFLAAARATFSESVTNRPIIGEIEFCLVVPGQLIYEVTTAVHEIFHVMVSITRFETRDARNGTIN